MANSEVIELIVFLLFVAALVGIAFLVRRFLFDGTQTKEIVEAEKKRQAHPDIQSGRFTRLYTMPYSEDLNVKNICAYCEEHWPEYHCSVLGNRVRISDKRNGLFSEKRDLYITHLKGHNISAVELVDPNELVSNGRHGQFTTRSSINDKGFSKDIREMIRHFQQKAVSR